MYDSDDSDVDGDDEDKANSACKDGADFIDGDLILEMMMMMMNVI